MRQTCNRHRADGARCNRRTDHLDRWCRTCDGYIRSRPGHGIAAADVAPVHLDRAEAPCPLTVDDTAAVMVEPGVLNRFHAIHGGGADVAERTIRILAEDLAVDRRWKRNREGLVLAVDGYRLAVSADLTRVTKYGAVDPDLTWPQHRRGLKGRWGASEIIGTRRRQRRAVLAESGWHPHERNPEGWAAVSEMWFVHAGDGRVVVVGGDDLGRLRPARWRATLRKLGVETVEGR